MNHSRIKTFLFLIAILLTGCDFLQEKKTFEVKSNGLTVVNDYLMTGNIKSTETDFVLGSEVQYFLEGVSGFSIKDGKVLFGASMIIADAEGKEVLKYDDLFSENTEGYSTEDANKLNFTLAVGNPMVVGGNYFWRLRIWDKRGKNSLLAEMPFTVSQPEDLVGVNTQTSGLKPEKVFVISNGSLKSTDVQVGQKLTLYFENVDGYALQPDSTVSVGASMVVVDKEGNNVLEYSDVFEQNPAVSPEKVKSVSLYLIVGDPMKVGETYLWKMILWDKNEPKSVESSLSLTVVK